MKQQGFITNVILRYVVSYSASCTSEVVQSCAVTELQFEFDRPQYIAWPDMKRTVELSSFLTCIKLSVTDLFDRVEQNPSSRTHSQRLRIPGHRPATNWVHYTTSCRTQSNAPEDGKKLPEIC